MLFSTQLVTALDLIYLGGVSHKLLSAIFYLTRTGDRTEKKLLAFLLL